MHVSLWSAQNYTTISMYMGNLPCPSKFYLDHGSGGITIMSTFRRHVADICPTQNPSTGVNRAHLYIHAYHKVME
jgi:hypothetical protein